MPEIIQDWLGTRLGVVLDLSPQNFGRNTKDGVLLAKVLYGYGVIPTYVLQKIKETKNYYECYENLKILKPWLDYIGAGQDESSLQEVAGGKGSRAISLFYEVYLNLEMKNTLHYLITQKARRFSDSSCKRKFKVEWVPEKQVTCDSGETLPEVTVAFLEKSDMIDWHRTKCKEVIEKIKKVKDKFLRQKVRPVKTKPVSLKHETSHSQEKCFEEKDEIEEIYSFEKRHLQKCPNLNYSELINLKNALGEAASLPVPNSDEARKILSDFKNRRKSEVYAINFQEIMQYKVLDDQWKEITRKQEKKIEEAVYSTLLKQSQYEKQITSKLYQLRRQKKVMADNRKFIESLKTEQRDKEFDEVLTDKMEIKDSYLKNEDFERERLARLHRKVYNEKVKARRQFINTECQSIIQSISDIAIRISEIRRVTSCQVPKALMKDLKELFFKNLPIFDILSNFEELFVDESQINEETSEENEEEGLTCDIYNQMKIQERHRQSVLNETDFIDYLNLLGPWMVQLFFPDGPERETNQIVLGYIVHKLLEVKYPPPSRPSRVSIKPMKPKAVILDLEGDAGKMISDLMETNRILVVNATDAINYILSVYKEELSVVRDIDIVFQNLTNKALQKKESTDREKEVKKKVLLLKKEEKETMVVEDPEPNSLDKNTQTPKMIPDDDPLLSPDAALGRMAFETLGAGDPVPDTVISSAIVAYVGSKQTDYDGWVLLNYPRLYVQASELECALTGYRLLPITDECSTLGDIEGFNFREPCVDPFSSDDFAANRISRLVPKPTPETALPENPRTYFDIYIKCKKIRETPGKVHSEESNLNATVEEFYSNQGIFQEFEYFSLNFQTVKNIAKIILCEKFQGDENDFSMAPQTSLELFGPAILELNEKWELEKKKNPKASQKTEDESSKRPKLKEGIPIETPVSPTDHAQNKTAEGSKTMVKKSAEASRTAAKPGDPEWEWVTGNQADSLLEALATLWENMEVAYIDDFKDIFFCLRTHRSNVLSYCEFIRNSVQNLMRQPDEKQKVLADFQQMFNEIDFDLRPDVDIKCELHVRVSELEEALLGIAEERKANFLKDLSKVTRDGWVADEMANLVNHFLNALQLEADRCVVTCQILVDYYASIQQKVPDEKLIGKITVSKLQIKDRKYSILSSQSCANQVPPATKNVDLRKSSRLQGDQGSRAPIERPSKTRSWTEKRRKSSDSNFLTGCSEVITDILVNLSLPGDGTTPFHGFFKESVQGTTNEITGILENFLSEVSKGDKSVSKNPKKGSETNPPPGGNVALEWETSLNNELSRFLFRAKLILARGIFDMNEFLATMLNILSSLTEEINEMYLREVKSISECCKVFRCCIEEEIPVRYQLILKEDNFFVGDETPLPREESFRFEKDSAFDKFTFSPDQLCVLFEKLNRVAPDGEIIKRSLLFILQDLRAFNAEIKSCDCFPEAWKSLDPDDMVNVLNEMYQDLEIVPWKDFIIYALEIPAPSEDDILTMRKRFKEVDVPQTELIGRDDYKKVRFWFENANASCSVRNANERMRDLLFRMYQVDEYRTNYSALLLAFCKDENPIFGFTKALALITGKKINTNEYVDEDYFDGPEEYCHGEEVEEEEEGESNFFGAYKDTNDTFKKSCLCLSTSSENFTKCIPRERMIRCPCGSPTLQDKDASFTETWGSEGTEQKGEATSFFLENFKDTEEGSVVSSVPYTILSSLFKASFPALSQLSALLDCKQTFQDTLNSIYDGLESRDNCVEVYKLLRHKFVSRLIECTNKFRFMSAKAILIDKLNSKNLLSPRISSCQFENANRNLCYD